jgi:hypothetical protein
MSSSIADVLCLEIRTNTSGLFLNVIELSSSYAHVCARVLQHSFSLSNLHLNIREHTVTVFSGGLGAPRVFSATRSLLGLETVVNNYLLYPNII